GNMLIIVDLIDIGLDWRAAVAGADIASTSPAYPSVRTRPAGYTALAGAVPRGAAVFVHR
ncbi:MAG TPA: hypothetical protein VNL71_06395, partial [Chloroflexota bacterium]|nr:hypothetical protein [Chloroflexota bacterium]